jgi:hypothetical protein
LGESQLKAGLGKKIKVCKTLSQPIKLGVVVHNCNLSCMADINRKIPFQASPGKNESHYSKNN